MAIKGVTTPVFGDYSYDGNKAVYTNGFIAMKAIEYGLEVESSDDNHLHADDEVAEHDYGRFTGGTLTLNTSDLDYYTSMRMLNLKEVTFKSGDIEVKELVTDDDATPTPKGFGIIETHQINDKDAYRAVILTKVTPKSPSEAATTKGTEIEWQTKELECSVERSEEVSENYNHPWKREAWFDTRYGALEYLRTVLNVLGRLEISSEEGTETGKTKLIVETVKGTGNAYKYSVEGPAPAYKEDLTSWEDWEGEEIQADNGKTLYLAEVNVDKKAVKFGTVQVKAKGE